MSSGTQRAPRLLWILAALLFAGLVLSLGINAPTGLTGKDEYFLGLRIPLEMIERNNWWIPFIDAEPRLRKPPFIYWLTRLSYESFGASLLSARLVTVSFSLLLLASTAWLGKYFSGKWTTGLLAAGVMLGFAGMATESRRLMLDIPVAALSTAAFCTYLAWLKQPRWRLLLLTAGLLAAALMTKGPVALVAFGSGFVALWLTPDVTTDALSAQSGISRACQHFKQHAGAYIACGALAGLLPALWYMDAIHTYPEQFSAAAQDEIEARSNSGPSFAPLSGLLLLTIPWTLIGLNSLFRNRRAPEIRRSAAWLIISLLPFFFVRSFERYLLGSLPAFALICAYGLQHGRSERWPLRLGALLPAFVVGLLCALLWRWEHRTTALIVGSALVFFILVWNTRANNQTSAPSLTLSAALLWSVAWGVGFPSLKVNAIPDTAIELSKNRRLLMFEGPQPALLPILSQRAMRHVQHLRDANDLLVAGSIISIRQEDELRFQGELRDTQRNAREIYRYQSLTTAGSGIRFGKQGSTWQDWQQAWQEKSPRRLMSTVIFYEILP